MPDAPDLLRALRLRRHLGRTNLIRGQAPSRPDLAYDASLGKGCIIALVVLLAIPLALIALVAAVFALQLAIDLVIVLGILLVVTPFRHWVLPAFRGEPLHASAFAATSPVAMALLGAIPASGLTYGLSHQALSAALAGVIGAVAFRPVVGALDGKHLPRITRPGSSPSTTSFAAIEPDLETPGEFGLWMGEATGKLAAMGHTAGIQRGSNVTLNLRDAAKNIAIFGETGTGKTTRVINHLLVQALDFDCGALIFDVRGDFYETAARAAQLTGKTIQRIGIGQLGVNLLDGLTPNTAAGFLEATFLLLGQGEGDSGFWVSLAVARCQNALAVLQHLPGRYTLTGLYPSSTIARAETPSLAPPRSSPICSCGPLMAIARRTSQAADSKPHSITKRASPPAIPTKNAAVSIAPSKPPSRASRILNSKTRSAALMALKLGSPTS